MRRHARLTANGIETDWGPSRIREAFEETYRAEYGNTLPGIAVVLIGLKTAVHGIRTKVDEKPAKPVEGRAAQPRTHR